MFSLRSDTDKKADLLGVRLVGGATEVAQIIVEKLAENRPFNFRAPNSAQQFIIEFVVFYMHLVDRVAFTHLGADKRQKFADRFVGAVRKELLKEMIPVPGYDLGTMLRDTYNMRQTQYERYRVPMPKKDEPLKDTLFWEFSKLLLFSCTDDTNPATLAYLNILVADFTRIMMNKALKLDDVFPG